jgi:integrase
MPKGEKTRPPLRLDLRKEMTVRALKPAEKAYIAWDTGSALGVKVTPTGGKSFLVVYRHAGRARWMHLGRYPAVPLAEACASAGKVRARAALGDDPHGDKVAARARERDEITFEQLAAEYVAAKRKEGMRSLAQYERALRKEWLPAIGRKKAVDVTDDDVERVLDKIEQRGSAVSAGQVRYKLSAVYTWAIKDRRPKLKVANPTETVRADDADERERVLTPSEIEALWPRLGDGEQGRALRLLLMLGQRPGEVAGLLWEEIGEDWWWQLPAERSKSKRAHRIWIGPRARPLLGARGAGAVFPLLAERQGRLNDAFKAAAALAGIPTDPAEPSNARPHDFRRTFTTCVVEHGICDAFMAERMTNHALKGEMRTYQRAGFLRKMRAGWDGWADLLLDEITTGRLDDEAAGKVIDLSAAVVKK